MHGLGQRGHGFPLISDGVVPEERKRSLLTQKKTDSVWTKRKKITMEASITSWEAYGRPPLSRQHRIFSNCSSWWPGDVPPAHATGRDLTREQVCVCQRSSVSRCRDCHRKVNVNCWISFEEWRLLEQRTAKWERSNCSYIKINQTQSWPKSNYEIRNINIKTKTMDCYDTVQFVYCIYIYI